jgi:hypothetical protein
MFIFIKCDVCMGTAALEGSLPGEALGLAAPVTAAERLGSACGCISSNIRSKTRGSNEKQ